MKEHPLIDAARTLPLFQLEARIALRAVDDLIALQDKPGTTRAHLADYLIAARLAKAEVASRLASDEAGGHFAPIVRPEPPAPQPKPAPKRKEPAGGMTILRMPSRAELSLLDRARQAAADWECDEERGYVYFAMAPGIAPRGRMEPFPFQYSNELLAPGMFGAGTVAVPLCGGLLPSLRVATNAGADWRPVEPATLAA